MAAPVGWLVIVYLGSLALLLMAAFWDTEPFTSDVVRDWNLDNFRRILEQDVYRDVALRTITMAGLVTVADAVLAFPIAYYMARVASPRTRNLLVVAVLTPLLASYLVKAFAWNAMLGDDGFIAWFLEPFGIGQPGDPMGLWLDVHVLLATVHDPARLCRARADSDVVARSIGRPRSAIPADVPEGDAAARLSAVVAGSIFTFPLTLGDFILPTLIADRAVHRHGDLRRSKLEPAGSGGVCDGADRRHDPLPRRRAAARGLQGAVDGRVSSSPRTTPSRRPG